MNSLEFANTLRSLERAFAKIHVYEETNLFQAFPISDELAKELPTDIRDGGRFVPWELIVQHRLPGLSETRTPVFHLLLLFPVTYPHDPPVPFLISPTYLLLYLPLAIDQPITRFPNVCGSWKIKR